MEELRVEYVIPINPVEMIDCSFLLNKRKSKSRAGYDVECSYFKEYFNDEVKGLYHKKAVLEWCKTHDASVLRPHIQMVSAGSDRLYTR